MNIRTYLWRFLSFSWNIEFHFMPSYQKELVFIFEISEKISQQCDFQRKLNEFKKSISCYDFDQRLTFRWDFFFGCNDIITFLTYERMLHRIRVQIGTIWNSVIPDPPSSNCIFFSSGNSHAFLLPPQPPFFYLFFR